MCTPRFYTLVLFWLVLISSKDLDGGEPSDSILSPQRLVLVSVNSSNLDDSLKKIHIKNK